MLARMRHRLIQFQFAWAAFLVISVLATELRADPPAQIERRHPNIILINVDDADYELFSSQMLPNYPNLERLAKTGIEFTNFHVTTPFCGPSRASLFRGQYAHRCGVRVNVPESPLSLGFRGGYAEFLRQRHDRDELGVWLRNAGYRTMMVGKYHHNGFDYRKPEGWDDFYMSNGSRYRRTFRFTTRDDPSGKKMAPESNAYRTDLEAADAVRLIDRHQHRPFFLYIAPLAPHRPGGRDFSKMVNQFRYGDWLPDLRIPESPDLNEKDISDKPPLRQTEAYSDKEMATFQSEHLCRARSMKSVDDLLGNVYLTLEKAGLVDRTYIFFTSDNGYQLGHHRQHNKNDPYDRCTRVPLWVAGPGVMQGVQANHLIAHFDIAATVAELAGAELPAYADARSIVPLLRSPQHHPEDSWREFVIIENWQSKNNQGKVIPGTYSGLRFYESSYVEWATGDREYYDLKTDPYQIVNRFKSLPTTEQSSLHDQLLASRAVSMDPLVTIVDANAKNGVSAGGMTGSSIKGVAEDDRTVKQVKISIINNWTDEYWDGKSWSADPQVLVARQTARNQQMTYWHYPTDEIAAWHANHRQSNRREANVLPLTVRAVAEDAEGNQSVATERKIELVCSSDELPLANDRD
jgi:arylsulfatase A-like enzyme